MKVGAALMLNILGASTNMEEPYTSQKALSFLGSWHTLYGKAESRIGRKWHI
jgi:phosphoribosylaminoimidazole carboxylase (NCAIR synthetase)